MALYYSDWNVGGKLVKQDERYMRPAEVDVLRGDSTKAETELGWKPKSNFKDGLEKTIQWYLDNPEMLMNTSSTILEYSFKKSVKAS
mgnify:CR=1 FL=1